MSGISGRNNKLIVGVAGDICMRNLAELMDAQYSKTALSKIQPILDKADVRLINLENAVIKGGTPIHKSGPPLKANPENLAFLKEGHFDCAILANNHVGDYGEEGVFSTLRSLKKEGIAYVGAGKNLDDSYTPWYYEANNCKLAVIATCENEFGIAEAKKAGAAGFDLYRIIHTIKEAKANADFIMIIMHGGNEYNPIPSPRVVALYRTFVDIGADAVIGMHPHCVQGFETYNNAPIVYSIGNFLFSKFGDEDHKSPWYYGYIPLITFEKGKPAELEINPYRFNQECTLISPFEGEGKSAMLEYLMEISEPLKDKQLLQKFFKGWCIISGIPHAERVVFKKEFLDETEFPTGHPLLAIRNMYTCEAHNELLTVFLKMLADGKLDIGRSMVDEIRRLQKMPI
ncbi:MAG TPA: CapA family protein [Clostridiales bacterium]|nr:CapA family protein [Clostridiales bacterium]